MTPHFQYARTATLPSWMDPTSIVDVMHEIRPRLIGACSITIGDVELTPAAPHIFALLLALTLAPRDAWSRRSLQELLCVGSTDRMASHCLRQLLYRLRGFGVVVEETADGLLRVANPIGDPLASGSDTAASLQPSSVAYDVTPAGVLATYAPRMPAPFLDWLEQRRDVLQRGLAVRQMSVLRAARDRQDWVTTSRVAESLQRAESFSEELTMASAEAHAMLGRRDAAIEVIDAFLRETDAALDTRPQLRKLRARILATRITRREGTLRGREECLAYLADQWERAIAGGGGRVCAIVGPPGMGKTRVGELHAATVRLAGGQLLQHRCDSPSRQVPLALFSQLLPELRRRRGSIGADPSLRAALELIVTPEPSDAAPSVPAEDRREELKRAIVDLLDSVSAEQPMLIVIDDAHLLDDASRAVIRALASAPNAAQVLVTLLCRPRPDGHALLSPAGRLSSYVLPPLCDADSRALLLELSEPGQLNDRQIEWAVAQAGGNAFYLNALARHPCDQVSLPLHIKSLAQSSYLGLSSAARTVLDACLLLDTLASPARVSHVSAVEDRELLGALRELEESDLLRHEDGVFVGPHAITRDALRDLMPTTTRAILQRRIGALLSAECAGPSQAWMVASTAVSSLLATGDSAAAVEVALRVARHAASVGEPEAGAVLLGQIPRDTLVAGVQREVLDEIIGLADPGKCLALMGTALRERTALAVSAGEGSYAVAGYTIKTIACDLARHQSYDISTLQRLLSDSTLDPALRADAGARLIAIADLHFDSALASRAFTCLTSDLKGNHSKEPPFLRAQVAFHTSFGDPKTALASAKRLVTRFDAPSLDEQTRLSRSYSAVALLRLGYYAQSAALAQADWEHMSKMDHLSAAEYFGGIAIASLLNLGEIATARDILSDLQSATRRRSHSEATGPSALYSVAIMLAMLDRDYPEGERLIAEAKQSYAGMIAPRLRGAFLAHSIRLGQLRGDISNPSAIADLTTLFRSGYRLGAQDSTAESLWHAQTMRGDALGASIFLADYLSMRREHGAPEMLLRQSTASDTCWNTYRPTVLCANIAASMTPSARITHPPGIRGILAQTDAKSA